MGWKTFKKEHAIIIINVVVVAVFVPPPFFFSTSTSTSFFFQKQLHRRHGPLLDLRRPAERADCADLGSLLPHPWARVPLPLVREREEREREKKERGRKKKRVSKVFCFHFFLTRVTLSLSLSLRCCLGECVSGGLNLRVQQLDVRVETKSSDDVFLMIVVSIQYQYDPENTYSAFYKLSNLREQLSAYVFDVVRATVPKIPLNEVFTMKDQIAGAVKEELTKSMSGFGITIINTLVTDVSPDPTVRAAMNEIQV